MIYSLQALIISITANHVIFFMDQREEDAPTRLIDDVLAFFNPFKALEGLLLAKMNPFRKGQAVTHIAKVAIKGGTKWPWNKVATVDELIRASCDSDALKIQKIVGGDIITISNPIKGLTLGPVKVGEETVSEWFYHKAVRKGDTIYDRVTRPTGMPITEYKRLFEYADDLNFK